MSDNFEDTRPKPPTRSLGSSHRAGNEIPAPPRFLLGAVLGLFFIGFVGIVGGVVVFRNVLEPAQQQRIINVLPFMDEFLPARPGASDMLPTPESASSEDVSPDDLLSGLFDETTDENDIAPEIEETPEPEIIAPTQAEPEPTVEPSPTPQPTAEPTASTQDTAPDDSASTVDTSTGDTSIGAVTVEDTSSEQLASMSTTSLNQSLPSGARMSGFRHEQQTWNNCGPTNITMALTYYGWTRDQTYAADFLKPGGREDKNVNPSELVSFVNDNTDLRALTRMGGTVELVKAFIANNIPVIIETGYMPEAYDWIGHYQTVVGFDDNSGVFWLYDSYLGSGENGEGISVSYNYMSQYWQHFNRQFVIIYEPQRETAVRQILGDYADPAKAAELALKTATDEATANPTNGYAWFNMGSSLVALGEYNRAATAFDRAIREGLPWRMLWYQFGPYEAYWNTGRYKDVLSLTNSNLSIGGEYVEETYYWQGKALAESGDLSGAGVAFRNALRRNPRYEAARQALSDYGL